MPLTGEKRKAWQRAYRKRIREQSRQIVAAVTKGVPAQEHGAQVALQGVIGAHGLPLERLLGKCAEGLYAWKPWGNREDPCFVPDNDARLRAVQLAISLHERAGTIPSERSTQSGAQGFHLHVHLDGLDEAKGPEIDVTSRTG